MTEMTSPKVPELIRVHRILDMAPAICVSSDVSQPNIKSLVGQNESKALIWQICDPVGRGTQESVLKEYNWFGTFTKAAVSPMWYPLDSDDVAVVRYNVVLFSGITVVSYNLALKYIKETKRLWMSYEYSNVGTRAFLLSHDQPTVIRGLSVGLYILI